MKIEIVTAQNFSNVDMIDKQNSIIKLNKSKVLFFQKHTTGNEKLNNFLFSSEEIEFDVPVDFLNQKKTPPSIVLGNHKKKEVFCLISTNGNYSIEKPSSVEKKKNKFDYEEFYQRKIAINFTNTRIY